MNGMILEKDYSSEIQGLKDLIVVIQSNVNFTLSIVIAILSIAIAIAGVALFILARKWVSDISEKKFKEIEREIKSEVKKEVINYFEADTYLIPAKTTGVIPYDIEIDKVPSLFLGHKNQNEKCLITIKDNRIFLENLSNKDVSVELLIIGAKLRYKGPNVWDASI